MLDGHSRIGWSPGSPSRLDDTIQAIVVHFRGVELSPRIGELHEVAQRVEFELLREDLLPCIAVACNGAPQIVVFKCDGEIASSLRYRRNQPAHFVVFEFLPHLLGQSHCHPFFEEKVSGIEYTFRNHASRVSHPYLVAHRIIAIQIFMEQRVHHPHPEASPIIEIRGLVPTCVRDFDH